MLGLAEIEKGLSPEFSAGFGRASAGFVFKALVAFGPIRFTILSLRVQGLKFRV